MRDSPRRVFLNSTTQDRTPWDDLSRLVAALILDRVSGTLRSACLMSLIVRIVFVFAMSDPFMMKTSSRRNRRRSRACMPHGNSAETLRGRRDRNYSPSLLSGRYSGPGSHCCCEMAPVTAAYRRRFRNGSLKGYLGGLVCAVAHIMNQNQNSRIDVCVSARMHFLACVKSSAPDTKIMQPIRSRR